MTTIKDDIAAGFSKAADQYEQFALVQRQSLKYLHQIIKTINGQLPAGQLMEVGCGTGSLSRILADEMPKRHLLFTDISPGMLKKCQHNLSDLHQQARMAWQLMDGEKILAQKKFALIVSALTLQWFYDPIKALTQAAEALKKGGRLILSYVGEESFPEWRAICSKYQIPCTANPLPDTKGINCAVGELFTEVQTKEEIVRIKYPCVQDFFHSLKRTGSSTPLNNQALTMGQMRRLVHLWDDELAGRDLTITYIIQYIIGER